MLRTILVGMPPVMRDLVIHSVTSWARIEVVATLDRLDAVAQPAGALSPNLILIGLGKNETDIDVAWLVETFPRTTVVAFSSDARSAFVLRDRRPTAVLSDFSARELVEAILDPA
jgi:hypothetical protein